MNKEQLLLAMREIHACYPAHRAVADYPSDNPLDIFSAIVSGRHRVKAFSVTDLPTGVEWGIFFLAQKKRLRRFARRVEIRWGRLGWKDHDNWVDVARIVGARLEQAPEELEGMRRGLIRIFEVWAEGGPFEVADGRMVKPKATPRG